MVLSNIRQFVQEMNDNEKKLIRDRTRALQLTA